MSSEFECPGWTIYLEGWRCLEHLLASCWFSCSQIRFCLFSETLSLRSSTNGSWCAWCLSCVVLVLDLNVFQFGFLSAFGAVPQFSVEHRNRMRRELCLRVRAVSRHRRKNKSNQNETKQQKQRRFISDSHKLASATRERSLWSDNSDLLLLFGGCRAQSWGMLQMTKWHFL